MTIEHGFKVRNHRSEIQVDPRLSNYVYVQGGDSGSWGANHRQTITFDNPSKYPPIVLVRPTADNGYVTMETLSTSGGKYSSVRFLSADNSSFKYRIFYNKADISVAPKEEDYGLRVRDQHGHLVYDSWGYPFKIVQKNDETLPSESAGDSGTVTHLDYSEPWYIVCPMHVAMRCSGTEYPGIFYWAAFITGIKRLSATSCCALWSQSWGTAYAGGGNFFTCQGTEARIIVCTVPDEIQENS